MAMSRFVFTALWALTFPFFCAAQEQGQAQITFNQPDDQSLATKSFTISATGQDSTKKALAASAITFTADPKKVCEVSGTTVTLVGPGVCTITASASGATPVTRAFTVNNFVGVDVVFGIGSLITGNRTSYKVNSAATTPVLEGTLIGRASPQLLAGLAFQLPAPSLWRTQPKLGDANYHPWHAFASLKFSTESGQTIIGYTFGITYRIMPYLDLLLGYTLTPFQDPAPGFRNAAVQAVQSNLALLAAGKTDPYVNFNGPALNNNRAGAFDGFPVQVAAGSNVGTVGQNLYNGSPLEPHYRGGVLIGISVPVSLNGILGIPKK
jgi:hypothetical protein